MGSASVKKLKTGLDAMIIKLEGSRYVPRQVHTVINWGNSRVPDWMSDSVRVLNRPENVSAASNKDVAFISLASSGVLTVPFTTLQSTAQQWLDTGSKVFVRNVLNGHSGEGIQVIEPSSSTADVTQFQQLASDIIEEISEDAESETDRGLIERLRDTVRDVIRQNPRVNRVQLPTAPLYTRAVSNSGEYRVHVMNGEVILYQKKSRRLNDDGTVATADGESSDVRNLASNWVYRTGNLRRLERVEQLAIEAVAALGLDFGAVDIIKDNNGDVFVLEVNTAPGLGNTDTLEAYVNGFNRLA